MRTLRTRPILVAGCAVAALCGGLQAEQECDYRSVSSAVWNQHTTWNCWNGTNFVSCGDSFFIGKKCYQTPPGTGDTATIAEQTTVYIEGTSESVWYLTIEDHATTPGVLELRSASSTSSLTIEDELAMNTGPDPGTIKFVDGSSWDHLGKLIIEGSGIFAAGLIEVSASNVNGGGEISVLNSNTLEIRGGLDVADGTLTASGLVHVKDGGHVTVAGGDLIFEDEFENDGEFTISGGFTAKFNEGIAAGSSGDWDIDHADAVLHLVEDSDITVTGGDIQLKAGKIDADANFWFDGEMSWSGNQSEIDVAAERVFHATSDG